jgi:Ca2+:H+ antiporter
MTDPTPPAAPPPLGDAARLLVEAAQIEAKSLGHPFVGTEHLLLALLANASLEEAARELGVPGRDELRTRLAESGPPRGVPGAGEGGLSPQARRLLEGAERQAAEQGRTTPELRWVLERIVTAPRGALSRLLKPGTAKASEAQPAPVPAETAAGSEGQDQPSRPGRQEKPARPERAKKDRGAGRATQPTREGREKTPRAERPPRTERPTPPPEREANRREPRAAKGPPRQRTATPVVIRSRPAFRIPWRLLLLLLVPATIVLDTVVHANPLVIFVVACLGVIPLAGFMGEATEHLAARTGPAVGGLLNATFGNAAELIIAIVALRAGLVDLVKASITGSILGNLLLIMGLSFIAGGIGRPVLRFSRVSVGASAGMLALAVVGLVFPALFHSIHPDAGLLAELHLSEVVAVVLAVTYGFSLLFSLRTHRSLFSGEPHPIAERLWKPVMAILVLAAATAGVAVQSEILVHAVQGVTATMGLSETFLGLIVIPLIGNAAEHATAVVVARKGQMDLSLQIALGSSTQVALLVAPILVGAGVLLGQPMNLVFSTFEVAALGLTTVITAIITLDGESHWFEGIQLLATFALVAAMAFFV